MQEFRVHTVHIPAATPRARCGLTTQGATDSTAVVCSAQLFSSSVHVNRRTYLLSLLCRITGEVQAGCCYARVHILILLLAAAVE